VNEKIKNAYSALKAPFSKELIADIFLIAAFGYLSIQFILRFHNLLAAIAVLVSLGFLLKSLIYSVFYIFSNLTQKFSKSIMGSGNMENDYEQKSMRWLKRWSIIRL
jgi:uncharacterized membrane protein YciS (DUF1049 family)